MTAQCKLARIEFDIGLVNPKSMALYLTSGPIHDRTTNSDEHELA